MSLWSSKQMCLTLNYHHVCHITRCLRWTVHSVKVCPATRALRASHHARCSACILSFQDGAFYLKSLLSSTSPQCSSFNTNPFEEQSSMQWKTRHPRIKMTRSVERKGVATIYSSRYGGATYFLKKKRAVMIRTANGTDQGGFPW
jgi:hypothetical protein